ncbi:flagellar biosynthetic protein FliO [Accumulibacter sp.]|uniref:flagellar biosynthetic protein FliO n=1 Tax=Accumulibacter sp. TaxID=2053492 RepID=UPI0025CD82A2|nr:flagellar biosynthetic protein FliO [Accumulibacter sp.]MCM8596251.1 flagellar biosynthetic protein FliO [Accumulibacter sp.]MCM8627182.1 flagellar biosynthetic protein FliO [Accumulibacter sp.]MDS4050400.1 flagellar biosynthetic protein FliO [Accumulibacter sp.]
MTRPVQILRHIAGHAGTMLASLLPASALAQASAEPLVPAMAIMQTVLALLAVVGVLLLAAHVLRRLNRGHGFGSSGPLRVVGGAMIGPRERIILVEVGDTWIVVGLVPSQIRCLHTLPKGETKAPGNGEKHFAQWLKQLTERRNEDG